MINKKNLNKDILENLYNERHLGSARIGQILGCSDVTVNTYLRLYGIKFKEYYKECSLCKKKFIVKSIAGSTNFCSKKCLDRDYYVKVRVPIEVKGQREKNCLCCNKLFLTAKPSPNQIYCSSYCAHKYQKKLKPEYFKSAHKKYYKQNKDKIIQKARIWRITNPEEYHKRNKICYQKRRLERIESAGKWYKIYKQEENERRIKLGLPLVGQGFMKEMELLLYVHNIFQNYEIMTHHRKWNTWGHHGLELDIYLPELKLAFEYMGRQHYEFAYFESLCKVNRLPESFEYQQYKDKCKKTICRLKGITLIRIKYNERLSEQLIISKLKYLPVKIKQNII